MDKTIYDLELHEQLRPLGGMIVTRVASGWVYQFDRGDGVYEQCFVPFYNKFMEVNPV